MSEYPNFENLVY